MLPTANGLEVYSCHFNISFEIPSDNVMFYVLTEGDRPERESLELFIDGEWALYRTNQEGCDAYLHQESIAGALHGKPGKDEDKVDRTGQTEVQRQQTKDFLLGMLLNCRPYFL